MGSWIQNREAVERKCDMKKQRIFLHTLILVLAAACFGTAAYGWTKYANVKAKNEYRWEYQSQYEQIIKASMWDIAGVYLYIKNFSNDDKILVKSKEYGNLTAKDIKEIYKDEDRKKEFYNKLYDSSQVYNDDEVNLTDEQDKQYNYYKKIVEYIVEYDNISDNNNVKNIINNKTDIPEPEAEIDGVNYELLFKNGEKTYRISTSNDLNDSRYRDYCIIEGNQIESLDNKGIMKDFTVDVENAWSEFIENAFVDIYIESAEDSLQVYYYEDEYNDFVKSVVSASYAIDKSKNSYLNRLYKQYNNAPEDKSGIIKKEIVIALVCGVCVLTAFVIYLILMCMAGHKEKGDEASINKIDKLWWDVAVIVLISVSFIAMIPLLQEASYFWYHDGKDIFNIIMAVTGVVSLLIVESVLLLSESFFRRIKCKAFWKTTLIGKICNGIKKAISYLMLNIKTSILVIVFGVLSFLWCSFSVITACNGENAWLGLVMMVVLIIIVCGAIFIFIKEYDSINEGTKKIADGNLEYKVEGDYKFKLNRNLKESINNIGDGLSKAVAESVKNERTKTELITNVSHDLKTPLTSIINYVGLLKTEGLKSDNAEKYLEVIDRKSIRLKNLTEDLVEASKLNAGAINFEMQQIDIVQLVNQSLGEYEEKFEEKHLTVMKTIQEEPLYVMADGRKTWRVFENLYGNIYKYAMDNTRVYVDITRQNDKVIIFIRNISASPLNFNAKELTERFVRGDKSRTTEGSGLGLSIAKSIVEKQNGQMNIYLDGDLFKVEIMMNLKQA